MAKAKTITGCKLVTTFSDGSTVEQDFGEYLADFTSESRPQYRDKEQRKVTTLVFRTPWEPKEES